MQMSVKQSLTINKQGCDEYPGTRGAGRVYQLPGYKFTTRYPNANYRMYKKKEFQANRAKFNVTGLYKLPQHLPTAFTNISTFSYPSHAPMCQGLDRQTDATYYFHSNVYFLTVDMPIML